MGPMIAANSSSSLGGAVRWAGVLVGLVFLAALSTAQESSNPTGASTTSDLFTRVIQTRKRRKPSSTTTSVPSAFKKELRVRILPRHYLLSALSGRSGRKQLPLSPARKPAHSDSYRNDLEKLERYLAWAAEDGSSQKDAYTRAEHKRKERFPSWMPPTTPLFSNGKARKCVVIAPCFATA